MPKFRRKPEIIEAEQLTRGTPLPFSDVGPIVSFDGDSWWVSSGIGGGDEFRIAIGDWVTRSADGRFGMMSGDRLAENYEPVEESHA